MPPALQFITLCQFMSFAFGPSTNWRPSVKNKVKYVFRLALLGTEMDLTLNVDAATKFSWEFTLARVFMISFIVFELVGAYEVLCEAIRTLQSSQTFKTAELEGKVTYLHAVRWFLRQVRIIFQGMAWVSCTLAVAPLTKICAQALPCSWRESPMYNDTLGRTLGAQSNGTFSYYLDIANEVECELIPILHIPYGLRWPGMNDFAYFSSCTLPIMIVYALGLCPYAVVGGDVTYVQRDELFEREDWRDNARRKATALNLGLWHPDPRTIYWHLLIELASKFALPFFSFYIQEPHLQMSISVIIMAILYFEAVIMPAYIDQKYCAVVEGCRLESLMAMICGLTTTFVGKDSLIPMGMFIATLVIFPAYTFLRVVRHEGTQRTVLRRYTSDHFPTIANAEVVQDEE